jgi:chitodextrinase
MRGSRLILTALVCLAVISCKTGGDQQTNTTGEQPQITSVTPGSLNPGTAHVEGSIFGKNLNGVISVNLGEGVVIERYSGISSTEIYIFVSVTPDAPPGPRNVSVQTNGGVATSSNAFSVGDNVLPNASFTVTPPAGIKATNFRFDASRSNDRDGNITNYQWLFGDGKTASGRVVNHQYNSANDFDVRLTVTDNRSASNTSSRLLFVDASKSPTAQFSINPPSGDLGTNFTFDASASHDPDGQIKQYIWNFGDGTGGNGKIAQHRYNSVSFFPVKLTVSDNTNMSAVNTQFVKINDAPPPPGDDDDDDGGGSECTEPARRGPIIFGTVLSADPSSNTAIVQFDPNLTCRTGFYNCGDFRKTDPEKFYGIVRRMFDLGGGKFQVQVDCPVIFPDEPGDSVFIIYKTCSENFCPD